MSLSKGKTKKVFIGFAAGVFLLTFMQTAFAMVRVAKNVILMISDGQGFNTVRATEYYTGGKASYEYFAHKFGMQTHSAGKRNGRVGAPYDPAAMAADFNYAKKGATDSSSAATAMYTGVKVYDREVNYTPGNTVLQTFFEKAAKAGKSIGAVSTVNWTHGTPVAVFGHNIKRGNYGQMAKEAIYGCHPNGKNADYDARNYYNNLKLVMGAGNPFYTNDAKPQAPKYGNIGEEAHWNDLLNGVNGWTLITTKQEFEALAAARKTPDKVFGVPRAYDTLQYNRAGLGAANGKELPYKTALNQDVPDLATMTKAALNVLGRNREGFAIMIESGAVDWANHANLAGRMIEEQIDFNKAVEAVIRYLDNNTSGNNWNNTLLIVTADHETGHLWGDGRVDGSTFFDVNENGVFDHGADYAHVKDNGAGKLPDVWFHSGRHSNSLVPFYARGAFSDHFNKCVVGTDRNLRAIYNLDSSWNGKYIDNTCVYTIMSGASLDEKAGPKP